MELGAFPEQLLSFSGEFQAVESSPSVFLFIPGQDVPPQRELRGCAQPQRTTRRPRPAIASSRETAWGTLN